MDTAWAQKRRARLTLTLATIGFVLLAAYFAITLYRPSTCFDNKQNQDEVGVDCGGTCSLLCTSQTQELHTVWARPFRVSEGWYSALAYVENTNFTARAGEVPYRFQFYDRNGLLLTERSGTTFVTKDPIMPVYVGRVDTKMQEVDRVTFEWLRRPVWHRDDDPPRRLSFEEQKIVPTHTGQDLVVVAHNQDLITLYDVRVVAIVYDAQENAIAASETLIERILPQSKETITFFWPEPFSTTPSRIEILPRIPVQP